MAVRWGRGGLELDPAGGDSYGHRPASGDHPSLPSPVPRPFPLPFAEWVGTGRRQGPVSPVLTSSLPTTVPLLF